MTLRVSTGFKERILGPTAFESIFNDGRILVYSGPQPSSPDLPAQGVLLGQITNLGVAWVANGVAGGLRFTRSGIWVAKDAAQDWRLIVSANGTAGWFRLAGKAIDNVDDGSVHAPRIDGAIGAGGAVQLTLGSTALAIGQNIPVQQFLYSIPTIGA